MEVHSDTVTKKMKEKLLNLIENIKQQPEIRRLNILSVLEKLQTTDVNNIETIFIKHLVPTLTKDIELLQTLTHKLVENQSKKNLSHEKIEEQKKIYENINKNMSLCWDAYDLITAETKSTQTNLQNSLNKLTFDLNTYTQTINDLPQKLPEKTSFLASIRSWQPFKSNPEKKIIPEDVPLISSPIIIEKVSHQAQKTVKKIAIITENPSTIKPSVNMQHHTEPKNIIAKLQPIYTQQETLFANVDEKIELPYCTKTQETIDFAKNNLTKVDENIKEFHKKNITNFDELKKSSLNSDEVKEKLITIEIFLQEQFSIIIETLNDLKKFQTLSIENKNISKKMNHVNKEFLKCFEKAATWKNLLKNSLDKTFKNKNIVAFEDLKKTKEEIKKTIENNISFPLDLKQYNDHLTFLNTFEELLQQEEPTGYVMKNGQYQYIRPEISPLRKEVIALKKELEDYVSSSFKNHQTQIMSNFHENSAKNKKIIIEDVRKNIPSFTKTESYEKYLSDLEAKAMWLHKASNYLPSASWHARQEILFFKRELECCVAEELTKHEVSIRKKVRSFEENKKQLLNRFDSDYKNCLVFLSDSEIWLNNIDSNIPCGDFTADKILLLERIIELKHALLMPLNNQKDITVLQNSNPLNIHLLNKLIITHYEKEVNPLINSLEKIKENLRFNDSCTATMAYTEIKEQKISEALDDTFGKISLLDINTNDNSKKNLENIEKIIQLKTSIGTCKDDIGSIKLNSQQKEKVDLTKKTAILNNEQEKKKEILTPTKSSFYQPAKTPPKIMTKVTFTFTPKKNEF